MPSRGYSNSYITFDPDKNHWILQSLRFPEKIYAMARGDDNETPIGRKSWEKIMDGESSGARAMTLSSCNEDEFTCDTGACVPLALV